jgi:diketogulonate reductase-like aldo/keto reductase
MDFKSLSESFTLNNGVKIPCVGFGTWKTQNGETTVNAVKAALLSGYRHIDAAAVYQNETSVGKGIKESGVPRNDIFVTSKLANTEHTYEQARSAFNKSLNDLQLEYLDLYLIHWPNPKAYRDHWAEANAECWRAFEELYRAGKIRAIGVSNFHRHHLEALDKVATIKPQVNQIRLCPGDTKDEVVKASLDYNLLLEAYSPLGGSDTTNILKAPLLIELAKKYGKTTAQISVRWCLQRGFLPLPKSATPAHIADNAKVFDFILSDEDITALNTLPGYPDPFPHPDNTIW